MYTSCWGRVNLISNNNFTHTHKYTHITIIAGKDFVPPSAINISCNGTLPCHKQIRIEIINDAIPEPEREGLEIRFSEPPEYDITFNPDAISIEIMDDDGILTYFFCKILVMYFSFDSCHIWFYGH